MNGDPLFGPDGTQPPSGRAEDRGRPDDSPATTAETAGPVEQAEEPEPVRTTDRLSSAEPPPDETPTPPSGTRLPAPPADLAPGPAASAPGPRPDPQPPAAPGPRPEPQPPATAHQPARPNARPPFRDDEPSLFGLTRRSRSRFGSRLFTAVFVAIFVLIFLQLLTRLYTGG